MPINADFLIRCINTLESAFEQLQQREPGDTFYEIFRAASVKEFEIVLEQSGRPTQEAAEALLRQQQAGRPADLQGRLRHAAKHDLISVEACERWFAYRDNRNDTAHDYGEKFAETTLKLLPDFITDARELARVMAEGEDD